MSFRGKGLPGLASCPAPPPAVKSFLKLAPSMNTFTLSAGNAPPANVLKVLFRPLFKTVVPGASATRPRKLRSDSGRDRKSTRLNSSHSQISYAVFCLKKKISLHVYERLTRGQQLYLQ